MPRTSAAGPAIAWMVQLGLAGTLAASHFTTESPYVYPHYVLLILLHPILLRYVGIRLPPWQRIYIAVALFLHPIGGLYGYYATVWWFDHVTHTLSATLVGAIGYVLARSYARRTGRHRSSWFVPVFTLGFVLVAGYAWEVIETLTPLLTVYGPNDTAWDYVFNTVGGLLVIIGGRFVLDDAADGVVDRLDNRLDAVSP